MSEKRRLAVFKICSNTEIVEEESGYYTISQFMKRLNEVKVHNIDVWCIDNDRINYFVETEKASGIRDATKVVISRELSNDLKDFLYKLYSKGNYDALKLYNRFFKKEVEKS